MSIDKGNTNEDVIAYDSTYGIQYPGVSGQNGGGNAIHFLYEIQATPTIVVINPDKSIAVQQIYPPSTSNVVDSVTTAGGVQQACLTSISKKYSEEMLVISPNPVRHEAQLRLNLKSDINLKIRLISLTGREVVVLPPEFFKEGIHTIQMDFSKLPQGLYFLQLIENNIILTTQKIIRTN
ncbi:MAG: T9SS type A sorting domain-containing protein [Bacteroidales bacterium]|nr:T9SS type A sorting domain-containing protein [Bacteroidales bacterium]MCF8404919.1 T9SS type A sorting domain-containing protein [Bacteroidales bacterium]